MSFPLYRYVLCNLHIKETTVKKSITWVFVYKSDSVYNIYYCCYTSFRDQRITQDVDKLSSQFSSIFSTLVITPFIVGYYTYQCYKRLAMLRWLIFVIKCSNNRAVWNYSVLIHTGRQFEIEVFFSEMSCYSMGYIGPVSIYGYFVFATVINKLIMAPIVQLVFKQEKLEGNFRWV